MFKNMKDFLLWEEATKDTIDVKKVYIDAAGDLVAGVLLSQIVFWFTPNKQGAEKLRVKKEGKLWLAKGRDDWWEECRITPKQFDRAIKVLQSNGLVEKKIFKFNGDPTVHITIDEDNFLDALSSLVFYQKGKRKFTEGEKGNLPNGKMEIDDSVNSLTEITTESTTENNNNSTSPPDPPAEPSGPQETPPENKDVVVESSSKKIKKELENKVDMLTDAGIHRKTAKMLAAKFSEERVFKALEYCKQKANGSLAGMLRRALEEEWPVEETNPNQNRPQVVFYREQEDKPYMRFKALKRHIEQWRKEGLMDTNINTFLDGAVNVKELFNQGLIWQE